VSEAAARLSSVAFDYIDRISEDVVAVYQQERDGWMRNRAAARSARIMALLANANVEPGELEKTLGFRPDQPYPRRGGLEHHAERFARAAQCRRALHRRTRPPVGQSTRTG